MSDKNYNVLFLCTGNSARSIIAEALMNYWGSGKFKGYSAGSFPARKVNPGTLKILEQMRIPLHEPRSKNWNEFAVAGAPVMDFVFTVCDNAAGEVCPIWPGQPMTAHWGVEDPAAVSGDAVKISFAFRKAFHELENRIKIFTSLPIASLDTVRLQKALNNIGKTHLEQQAS